jgi:predicted Zn-dependent peptidase
VFTQERLNHRREIEAQYNDKMTWAFQRLLDVTFGDEPYGMPVLGTVEQANALQGGDAIAAWTDLKERLPARVFAVGDFAMADVLAIADEFFATARPDADPAPAARPVPAAAEPRVLVERDDVSQSKLITARFVDLQNLDEREFDALRVYAGVLGGGFHSRMFQSIREKHSLAYFASASLDRLRGVLFTSCGIDAPREGERLTEKERDRVAARRAAARRRARGRGAHDLGGARDVRFGGGMVRPSRWGCRRGAYGHARRDLPLARRRDRGRRHAGGAPHRTGRTVYCLEGAARHAAAV